ncbi:bacteriohemerythrin [Candidatus Synechococcus calcipolaris]|nr:hemerythrin family protein [Candidatus Synechococcus calcipolaris]
MDHLAWQDQYALGHGEIDQQHRALLSLLRHLRQAIATSVDSTTIENSLQEIVNETLNHFRDEEKLMGGSNYPGYLGHRAAHQNLEAAMGKLVATFEADPASFTLETVAALGELILHHICEEDQPMVQFLNAPDATAATEGKLTAASLF